MPSGRPATGSSLSGQTQVEAPTATVQPNVESRPAYLDTHRLHTPEDFELLIYQMASDVCGLAHVQFYGTRGQTQHGIDIVGIDADDTVWAFQAKLYQEFGVANLQEAVSKFADAPRRDDGSRVLQVTNFVIAVACDSRRTQVVDTFHALREQAKTGDHPFNLHFWDRQSLSQMLRNQPDLVRRFFGDYTAERFCDAARNETSPTGESGNADDLTDEADSDADGSSPDVLVDVVMLGPERASGADTALTEARHLLAPNPGRAAELFALAEERLHSLGFSLQAALVSEARAQALVAGGQFSAAAKVLLARFWSALDAGAHFDCRRIEHELARIASASGSNRDAVAAAASVRAATEILRSPETGLTAASAVLAESVTSMGSLELARFASETAVAEGTWSWLTGNAAVLHSASHPRSEELSHDRLRIALCLADATDNWDDLLNRAQLATTPPMTSAIINARYARRCTYRQEQTTARQTWLKAAATAAEQGRNSDASEWLFAVSKLRMRFNPLDPNPDTARTSAQTLQSVHGPLPLYATLDNGRGAALDAIRTGQGSQTIENLRSYLRSSLAAGRWVDEDDARAMMAAALINMGELTAAARHLVTAGVTKFDDLLAAAGPQYLDVSTTLYDPRTSGYWQRAATLRLIEGQADLVPDNQIDGIVEFVLNVLALGTTNSLIDNHPMFAPSLYLSAHAVLAALADALTERQAQRLLDLLAPLIPRLPDHSRHSDESHVRACVAIAHHLPALRDSAIDQLLSLVETNDSAANLYIDRHARALFLNHHTLVTPRLERAAEEGNRHATELLADLEQADTTPNPARLEAAEEAFARLTEPVVHIPGVYSVGTSAPTDAVLTRVLPQPRLVTAIRAQLNRARDPASPLSNRADYLAAAFNLATRLSDDNAQPLLAAVENLTRDSGRSEDPLAEFGMPTTDLRTTSALLYAALARTPNQKRQALTIGLRLLAHVNTAGPTVNHILRLLKPADVDTLLPLLASRPEWMLRAYAASRWPDSTHPDVDLGLALAVDTDHRVQLALARAVANAAPNTPVDAVREALQSSPYRSARRTAAPQPE